jgi:hypothetical protein
MEQLVYRGKVVSFHEVSSVVLDTRTNKDITISSSYGNPPVSG